MPCYEIRLTTVEFKAEHKDLLIEALKGLKLQHTVRPNGEIWVDNRNIRLDLTAGKATMAEGSGNQNTLNAMKRSYTAQAVNKYAKLQGWVNQAKPGQQLTVSGQLIKF